MIIENLEGITVSQLKEFVRYLPSKDENGEDYQIWICSRVGLSSPCVEISNLNKGDILLSIK